MTLRFGEMCIDAADIHALGQWWSSVLGWPWEITKHNDVMLRSPQGGPNWLFLAVPDGKVVKNRIHFDFTPDDQQAEVDRLIGLGARHVDVGQPDASWASWVVLADPEGNEFCILAAED